jgi:hypothetical protein
MGRRQEDIQTPRAGTEPPVVTGREYTPPPTAREPQDTGATSTIEVGPLKARGRAADHLLRFGTPALLLVAVSGGIPAVWTGTSDLSAIKAEVATIKADVAELRRLQAEHIAAMQVTLARMPTAEQFAADHDEIIQLRATVSACCGGASQDRPTYRPTRSPRLEGPFGASPSPTYPPTDADASLPIADGADTSHDTDTAPVSPTVQQGVAGR